MNGFEKIYRHTVHTALNDIVAPVDLGIMGGRKGITDSQIVVAKLDDVLGANPGSLDNLASYDTMFTPAPGQPLVVPKGKYELIDQVDGVKSLQSDSSVNSGDVITTALAKVGVDPNFGKAGGRLPTSHEASGSKLFHDGITGIAYSKFRVGSTLHHGSVSHRHELVNANRFFEDSINSRMNGRFTTRDLAEVSENHALRYYDSDRITNARMIESQTNVNKDALDKLGVEYNIVYDTI